MLAAQYNIEDYGAIANDELDDTLAIRKAFSACEEADGGEVFIPAGIFIVSRQGTESPIIEIPSNTTVSGEGTSSTLKFDPEVNNTNFWRMLGAGPTGCQNVTIRDIHLDGSNTFMSYDKGKTPEQNYGVFFYNTKATIENVTIHDCLVENFSGDCIAMSKGCRNMTVRDVSLRNFVRQGIQMGGDSGSHDYLVTGCQDLEGEVKSAGSTIHVEHADGLKGVQITNNRCSQSILAGGVDGIIISNNVIQGRLAGNGNLNAVITGNFIRGRDDLKRFVVQFGYSNGLIFKNNIIIGNHEEAGGIYVWGSSRYRPEPSRNVLIADNLIQVRGDGIQLNGVDHGSISNNIISPVGAKTNIVQKRSQNIRLDTVAP
ncbi:Pectate lyase superfamily protein [Polystyrenella longa]|uniref:Pectate lyase superfamily protein n=1 Tax=Polystyrenella longa TaxID=2528007 RepID=A0A518CPP8_9PLAN|nr:Pectate lyase superfamily protein [Polystyrenella longa]